MTAGIKKSLTVKWEELKMKETKLPETGTVVSDYLKQRYRCFISILDGNDDSGIIRGYSAVHIMRIFRRSKK